MLGPQVALCETLSRRLKHTGFYLSMRLADRFSSVPGPSALVEKEEIGVSNRLCRTLQPEDFSWKYKLNTETHTMRFCKID